MQDIYTNKTYLSELFQELPSGVLLNKGITGCGGTYLELNSNRNSIILVPTKELAENKSEWGFVFHGKIKDEKLIEYLNSEIEYKKIIGTYDSLKRIMPLVPKNYFLLIDEYHILFNAYSYRNDAILYILDNYHYFEKFCFMTATPLDEDMILNEIKHIPRLNINWEKAVPIKVDIRDKNYTTVELLKILKSKDSCNYHIFLNSVNTIRDIINKSGITNYKVVCSEKSKKNLKTLTVGNTKSSIKKYNFYTAAAFEGCDIYDPIGKTVILCDTNISSTSLDISTLIRQISGRLRNSIYKDEITIILNTGKHRYVGISKEIFQSKVKNNIILGKYTEDKFKNDSDLLYKEKELRSFSELKYFDFYVNKKNNVLFFDDNLRKIDEYNYKLLKEIYANSITVMKEGNNNNFDIDLPIKEFDWIIKLLENKEYTLHELEEIFTNEFLKLDIKFNSRCITNYFPECVKTRRQRGKTRETFYKFNLK